MQTKKGSANRQHRDEEERKINHQEEERAKNNDGQEEASDQDAPARQTSSSVFALSLRVSRI